jgi:predicted secreted protein
MSEIIPIAQFCGQNKPGNKITVISVEKVGTCYFYLTDNGDRSTRYNNLGQAIADIKDVYGKWCGFKILVEV